MQVQAVAGEIEQKCRALIGICQEIQVPPMYVMDNVSLSLWQGRAAFEFQDAGTAQNKACSQVAQELNEMALSAVNKTNALLSSI